MTKAGQYTASGWMEDLPELNEGRRQHGCGFYFNNDMEKVCIVYCIFISFSIAIIGYTFSISSVKV